MFPDRRNVPARTRAFVAYVRSLLSDRGGVGDDG